MTRVEDIWPDWHGEVLLGTGAYGSVWRASHSVLGLTSQSAIKIMEFPQDPGEIAQLREMGMGEDKVHAYLEDMARGVLQEVAAMDALKGAPNVVSVEDCRLVTRNPGFAIGIRMELLEDLPSHFQRVGNPDAREVAKLGIDICRALEVCHDQGIIHRDIKPQNVFAGKYGNYLLGDFGIARRLEGSGSTVLSQRGTRSYMAPEVYFGQRYGSSVDIYSLGLMLYRYLNAGAPPFLDTTTGEVTMGTMEEADNRRIRGEALPAPTGADARLAAIVLKACAPVPQNRYASARRMREALEGWLAGGPTEQQVTASAAAEDTVLLGGRRDTVPTVAPDMPAQAAPKPAEVAAPKAFSTPKPAAPATSRAKPTPGPAKPKAAASSQPKSSTTPKPATPATSKPAATPRPAESAKPKPAATPKPAESAKPKAAEPKPTELVESKVYWNSAACAFYTVLLLTPMSVAVSMGEPTIAWIAVYAFGTAAFLYVYIKSKAEDTPAGKPRTKGQELFRRIVTYAIPLVELAGALMAMLNSSSTPLGAVLFVPLILYPLAVLIGLMVDNLLFDHGWERFAPCLALCVSAAFIRSACPYNPLSESVFSLVALVPSVWAQIRAVLYLFHKVDKLM